MSALTLELVTSLNEALSAGRRLFVPGLARIAPDMRALAGLMPIVDINGALIDALRASSGHAVGSDLVAGIFAADPFLNLQELGRSLALAGVLTVTNYPTIQHFDGAAGEGLAAVGYDAAAEFAVLKRLESQGFDVIACVTDVRSARLAASKGFQCLAFDPGPMKGRGVIAERHKVDRVAATTEAMVALIVTAPA